MFTAGSRLVQDTAGTEERAEEGFMFPAVEATAVHNGPSGSATSHEISIAALDAESGDLVVVAFAARNSGADTTVTITPPSGWDTVVSERFTSGNARPAVLVVRRIFNGSEGTAVTFSTDVSAWRAAVMYRITGYDSTTPVTGTTALNTVDPPEHDAGAVRDHLWLPGLVKAQGEVLDPITDYAILLTAQSTGANFVLAASCRRNLTAQSEDPGAWDTDTFRPIAYTLAVHPGEAVDQFTSGSQIVQASVGAIPEAFGTGAVVASGQAVGHVTLQASGTGAAEASGEATGHQTPVASGTGASVAEATGVGSTLPQASGAGSVENLGEATGRNIPVTSGTGVALASGTATGRTPADTAEASGTGAVTASGDAVGHVQMRASGTGAVEASGVAVGEAVSVDTFTTGSRVVQAAVTAETAEAAGTGVVVASGQAVGHHTAQASGTGSVVASGQATGSALEDAQASGIGTVEASGQATGHTTPVAAGTGQAVASGDATGHRSPLSAGAGAAEASGTGTGQAPSFIPRASGTGAVTASGQATGHQIPKVSGQGTATTVGTGFGYILPLSSGRGEVLAEAVALGHALPFASGIGEVIAAAVAVGRAEHPDFLRIEHGGAVAVGVEAGRRAVGLEHSKAVRANIEGG